MKRNCYYINRFWLIFVILISLFLVCQRCARGREYHGANPDLFLEDIIVPEGKEMKKIVSPEGRWIWFSSWHIVRRQPGLLGSGVGKAPYTLANSYDPETLEKFPWYLMSWAIYKGELPESYDPVPPAEKFLWKKFHHSGIILRIDKVSSKLYVITYVRGDHKKFEAQEVDSFPLFHLGNRVGINRNGISFDLNVRTIDSFGGTVFNTQRIFLSMRDVILLNPAFFQQPGELTDILIPYDFFTHHFIYEYKEIKSVWKIAGDPMEIKISPKGIVVRFLKTANPEVW